MSERDKDEAPSVEDDAKTTDIEEPAQEAPAEPEEAPAEMPDTGPDDTPDETPDATPDEAPEPAPVETPAAPARLGGAVGWLALIVSVAALAAVGYTIFQDWQQTDGDDGTADAIAALDSRLVENRGQIDALDALVAELVGRESVAPADIDALRQELDERVRLLNSLPARISTLESSMASLAGISEGARDTFLLAEAEYYMQIANAQLQLANNPHLASLALAMADERVTQLANPSLIDVRRAIADELAALAVMQKPDIAGTTLMLASLARVVDSLPLRTATPDEDEPAAEVAEEQSGVGRAWSSVKGAMSGLVKVTPPDQATFAVLTPDAEYFLRSNIALQLQAARLALLRGEQAVFEQSLDDTTALLEQYFDTDSTQVSSALQTIEEMRGNMEATAAPDISGSLDLLRQFQALRENAQ